MNNDIVWGKVHPNGQLTIPKDKREELDIEDGKDIVYFIIVKVIASDGMIKYEKEVKNGLRSKTK